MIDEQIKKFMAIAQVEKLVDASGHLMAQVCGKEMRKVLFERMPDILIPIGDAVEAMAKDVGNEVTLTMMLSIINAMAKRIAHDSAMVMMTDPDCATILEGGSYADS